MNQEPPNTRLRLSREEMRTLGYRVIDMLVEHVETLPDKPVSHAHQGARPRLEARLREPDCRGARKLQIRRRALRRARPSSTLLSTRGQHARSTPCRRMNNPD